MVYGAASEVWHAGEEPGGDRGDGGCIQRAGERGCGAAGGFSAADYERTIAVWALLLRDVRGGRCLRARDLGRLRILAEGVCCFGVGGDGAQTVLSTVPIVDVSNGWVYAAKVGGAGLLINLVGVAVYWRGKARAGKRI